MTLDQMKPGNECRVVTVNMEGVAGQRLLDMGFMPGTAISVIRNAPLMDPIDIRVKGYMLALRRSEAKGVEVTAL